MHGKIWNTWSGYRVLVKLCLSVSLHTCTGASRDKKKSRLGLHDRAEHHWVTSGAAPICDPWVKLHSSLSQGQPNFKIKNIGVSKDLSSIIVHKTGKSKISTTNLILCLPSCSLYADDTTFVHVSRPRPHDQVLQFNLLPSKQWKMAYIARESAQFKGFNWKKRQIRIKRGRM